MLRILFIFATLFLFQLNSSAAVVPQPAPAEGVFPLSAYLQKPTQKQSFLTRLQSRLVQKVAVKKLAHISKDKADSKKKLATISFILGLAGIAFVFIPYVSILVLLLAPAAIVTGILALKDNEDKKSRTKAIIGIVAGAVPLLIAVAIFAIFAIGGFSFVFE